MADQVIDRKEIGIPSDIDLVRHDVAIMRDEAGESKDAASASEEAAAASEAAALGHASDSRQAAHEAAYWATLHNQGIHFGPDEPEDKWDGMTWLFTNEVTRKIQSFRRWDAALAGSALWPSATTFPGNSTYPQDRGAWTDFSY